MVTCLSDEVESMCEETLSSMACYVRKSTAYFAAFRGRIGNGESEYGSQPGIVPGETAWGAEGEYGGAEGSRTLDLMTASHALSQLSYSPTL